MTDIERYILLNQSMIMTALAQLMDRCDPDIADHLDEASIKTNEFIKSFDNAASQDKEPDEEPFKNNLK